MNKKIISAALAFCLVLSSASYVLADPVNDLKKQQQQNTSALNGARDKIAQLEQQIEKMDSQIEKLMIQVSENDKQISKTQSDIKSTEQEISKAEQDIKTEQDTFNKRMRAMYISGNTGYLEILMDSDGLSDFVTKVEAVKSLADLDNKTVTGLKEKKELIQKKQDALSNDNKRLQALKADNEKKLQDLNKSKSDEKVLLAQSQAQEKLLKGKNDDIQKKIDKAVQEAKAQAEAQKKAAAASKSTSPSRGGIVVPASGNSSDLVSYALQFVGTPYVWGANGPSSFDCSGYVRYVFAHYGVFFQNRTTYGMVHEGTAVPLSQLQPGDVLYFGPDSDVHHVGIYIGNGCYVHAPKPGDHVRVADLGSRSDINCARRMR